MPDQANSRAERLQFDKQGKVVGKLTSTPQGYSVLLLEPGYILVKMDSTERIRLWDSNTRQLVEFM